MENLLIGVVTGAIFATWLHHLQAKPERYTKNTQSSVFQELLNEKTPKPDLKKARYYQSPAYKAEKKLIERYKKGATR